tara:strand:+ start:1101 stop:1559 length:459 start_codon:yes stop_codon:yes gene_type:complete
MSNLYFDILPYDIQKEIYGIRLSNALARTYYRKVAQKVALAYLVLRLQKLDSTGRGYFHLQPYYNPECPRVRYVIEKSCKIITNSDDRLWWISQLIRPIEKGLMLLSNIYSIQCSHMGIFISDNCARTEYACDQLINILGCRKNPNRMASLS